MDVIKNAGRRSAIMSKVEDILASTKVGDVLDAATVSYTHLDVYKRQVIRHMNFP